MTSHKGRNALPPAPITVQRRWWSLIIYSLTLILTIATLFLHQSLSVSSGERPMLILFMFPILVSALLGGFGPGLAATSIAAVSSAYFLIPPTGSFAFAANHNLLQWSMLIINGVLVSFLSESLHRSRQRETDKWQQLTAAKIQLRQSEIRFKATFEQAAVGIALVAPDGHWLRVNQKLCEILGYTEEELLTRTFQDITHPDDLQTDLELVRRMLLGGEIKTYSLEKRYLRKNGGIVWINLTVALVWKPDTSPDYFISIVEDIQARKLAEEQLSISEERLQLALEAATDGLWDCDLRSGLAYLTPHYYAMTGYLPDEVTPDFEFFKRTVHPDDLPHVLETIAAHMQGKTPDSEFDYRLITASGEVKWMTGRGRVVKRDAGGAPLRMIGTITDISSRKATEEALCLERDRNRNYLDTAQTLMIALNKEAKITMINRAGLKLLGYAEAELLGCDWFTTCLPQPEGNDIVYPVFRRIMAGEIEANEYFENEVLCRNGRRRLIAWHNAFLSDDADRVAGILSSGEDVTERNATEETLRQKTEELVQRNVELERFNRAMVGRELDMIALKQQVNELSRQLGQQPPYPLSLLDAPPVQQNEVDAP